MLHRKKTGFSVVEVILVIAILLGLVFVVVRVITSQDDTETSLETSVEETAAQQVEETEPIYADLTIVALGDSGTANDIQKQIAAYIEEIDYDFVLHTGDLAYGDGEKQQIIDKFEKIYSKNFRRHFYPTLGNHDYHTDSGQPYLDYFDLPKQALNKKDNERYYSFDKEGVHFIALDTNDPLDEISGDRDDDMGDWLKADLIGAQDAKAIIVFMHHPPYNSGKHGDDTRVQKKLVPLFEKYSVDLVLSGHDHDYQRTCPILNVDGQPKCNDTKGIPYVITGGGGREPYEIDDTFPDYLIKGIEDTNYVVLKISDNTIKLTAYNGENKKLDSFSIDL